MTGIIGVLGRLVKHPVKIIASRGRKSFRQVVGDTRAAREGSARPPARIPADYERATAAAMMMMMIASTQKPMATPKEIQHQSLALPDEWRAPL